MFSDTVMEKLVRIFLEKTGPTYRQMGRQVELIHVAEGIVTVDITPPSLGILLLLDQSLKQIPGVKAVVNRT